MRRQWRSDVVTRPWPWHTIKVRPDPLVASLLHEFSLLTHTPSLSLLCFQACSDSFSAFHSAVFQSQPSSEAVLIYRISHKQAANESASSGLRQHVYWKRKWIGTVRHGVFPIVLSAVYRRYVCESILISDSFHLHNKQHWERRRRGHTELREQIWHEKGGF